MQYQILLVEDDAQIREAVEDYFTGKEEDEIQVVKPFSLAVLYAKVKALIKRAKGMVGSPVLHVGDILLDPFGYSVTVRGGLVDITPKEYALLRYQMEHKGRVCGREELLIAIWGYDFEGTDRVVDNHIKKLRKLLGKCGTQIKTVRRAGYKIEEK